LRPRRSGRRGRPLLRQHREPRRDGADARAWARRARRHQRHHQPHAAHPRRHLPRRRRALHPHHRAELSERQSKARGKAMRQFLQALPLAAEFAIVILGGFGIFFVIAFLSLLNATTASNPDSTWWYSGGHLLSLIIYEVPVGAALFAFLHVRGWSLK